MNNNKCWKNFILPILLVLEGALFPILFLYFNNIAETSFKEVYIILLFFTFLSLTAYVIVNRILKRINTSAIITFIFIIILSNYMLIEQAINKIFSYLNYWHILPIVILVGLHITYFIITRITESSIKNITIPLVIALSALIVFNFVIALPTIISKRTSSLENDKYQIVAGQPNVYYMIFDECASFYVMEHYYNYKPTTFYDYLKNAGFEISDSSRNESGNTDSVLTNCINLDYVVNSNMTATELENYRKNPELYRLLKAQGYSIKGVGDTNWLNLESINNSKRNEGESIEGYDFKQLVVNKSFLAPFLRYTGTTAAKLILNSFDYMQNKDNIIPNNSEMTLLYLCTPHQPFLFDADGKSVSPQNYDNWENDQYYLGQYKFVSKQIQNIIENLLVNDPNCIILVSSDHGPRFKNEIPFEDKIRVLNAVYYKGEEIPEIQGQSIVNTLRIIMNKMFNMDMPLVEVRDGEE